MNAWARRGRTSALKPEEGNPNAVLPMAHGALASPRGRARLWARIRGCAKITNNHEIGAERFATKSFTLLKLIRKTQGELLPYNIYIHSN